MIGEILLGIFGNTIYDLIKEILKENLIDEDQELIERIYTALEKTSKEFFNEYGNQFGKPNSSFLARQKNIEIIVKSIFYGNNLNLVQELCSKGFDGARDVTTEALYFFTQQLEVFMMEDFKINKVITEKNHIFENKDTSRKIIELLDNLVEENQVKNNIKKEGFDGWVMTDESGNTSPLVEGKKHSIKFENGMESTYMFKDGLIYVDFLDMHGQKSYYELDIHGNVKSSKFPYELSKYKLIIPKDQIVHRNVIPLANGYYREVTKLKWDKQADVVYNFSKEIQHINLSGGWEVKHFEKIILPKL